VSVREIKAAPQQSTIAGLLQRARSSLRDLLDARELVVNLVRRDLKVRHRGTVLGMLWSLTTPLMMVGLYYVIFKYILGASPAPDAKDVPFAVFFFCGLTLWNLFNNAVGTATSSIVGAGYLLRKVYFPRAILPLTAVLSSVVTFGFELAVLLIAVLVFVGPPGIEILWLPVIVLIVATFAYGIGLFLSSTTVFFRDVAHFIGIFMQLWFWGTPIIYSLSYVANKPTFARIIKLNPMTGPVVDFRNALILDRPLDLTLLAYSAVAAVVALAIGGYVFHRQQRLFSEIV
jgi:ABC-type polysaccharide/polyol phosphate export permease